MGTTILASFIEADSALTVAKLHCGVRTCIETKRNMIMNVAKTAEQIHAVMVDHYTRAMDRVIGCGSEPNGIKNEVVTATVNGLANANALLATTIGLDFEEYNHLCRGAFENMTMLRADATRHSNKDTLH